MDCVIYTLGGVEYFTHTFNVIASLTHGDSANITETMIKSSALIGTLMSIVALGFGAARIGFSATWMVQFYFILSTLIMPSTTVIIRDPSTLETRTVDHVPIGLAGFASIMSKMSWGLCAKLESAFAMPDDLRYHKTGAFYGSRFIMESQQLTIVNQNTRSSLHNFVNDCVVPETWLGIRLTLDELKESPHLWETMKGAVTNARAFEYTPPEKGADSKLLLCRNGAAQLEADVAQATQKNMTIIDRKMLGGLPPASDLRSATHRTQALLSRTAMSYVPNIIQSFTGFMHTASEVMQQEMLINEVEDAVHERAAIYGRAAQGFADRKAYIAQKAQKETFFGVTDRTIVATKSILEILIYIAFIFIIPLVLLPGGWAFLKTWAGLVCWINLWPPLYGLLHAIRNMALSAQHKSITVDGMSTMATSRAILDLHSNMAAEAAGLAVMVGAIAYAITKGGPQAFMHMASSLSGAVTSSAGRAAESMVEGSYSVGSIAYQSKQMLNSNFGQINEAPSFSSGFLTHNSGDMTSAMTDDGGQFFDLRQSVLPERIELAKAMGTSMRTQAQHLESLSRQESMEAAMYESEAQRQQKEYSEYLSQSESQGDSWSSCRQTGHDLSANETHGISENFRQEHSKQDAYIDSKSRNESIAANVTIGGGKIFEALSPVSGNISGTIRGDLEQRWQDIESNNKVTSSDSSQNNQYSTSSRDSINYSTESRGSIHDETSRRYQDSINQSLEKAKSLRESSSLHHQQSEQIAKMAEQFESTTSTVSYNETQSFVDWAGHHVGQDRLKNALQDDQIRHELIEGYVQERTGEVLKHMPDNHYAVSYEAGQERMKEEFHASNPSHDPIQKLQKRNLGTSKEDVISGQEQQRFAIDKQAEDTSNEFIIRTKDTK